MIHRPHPRDTDPSDAVTKRLFFAATRQFTGDPLRFGAYVYRGNRVVWTCDHKHRRRAGISGQVFAHRCAERALKQFDEAER